MISQNKGKQRDDAPPRRRYTWESSPSPSSNKLYNSHHNDHLYQYPPRGPHRPKDYNAMEPRVYLSPFHWKDNIEEYLDWERKVEQLFKYH